jgi:hypothetical protein
MRDIHGECDWVRGIESLETTLGVHTLDCLQYARVLAVEQLHALLHNVQGRNYGVMDDGCASSGEHIAKHLVTITAALKSLLAQLIRRKVQRMAGYCCGAHGSDAPVQRQQPLLGDRMPRSVRDVAVPA